MKTAKRERVYRVKAYLVDEVDPKDPENWITVNNTSVLKDKETGELQGKIGKKIEKTSAKANRRSKYSLPDIRVGKSLGAKYKNFAIQSPDGRVLKLTEGTRITNVEVTAGKGRNRQIDMIDVIVDKYGGNPNEWQKVKGIGFVDVDGESYKAELHWYQEPTIGKVDWKLKPQSGGNYYIDEN